VKLTVATALVFCGIAVVVSSASQGGAVELTGTTLEGSSQALSSFRGKILVVNFWATWCVPCAHEMPLLADIQKRYPEQVQVLALSIDDEQTRKQIPEFLRKHKVNFPVWTGASTIDMQKLGLGEAIPATAFLDPEGRVVGRVLGQLRKRDLRPRIEWMLGERDGPEPPALINNLKN
jgi:thiol-disulfide isomerase/thioredoxin